MASGNLSPRQKMINMMYLVLTALLALNVSKEVLQSFKMVEESISRTTQSIAEKNSKTYEAFDRAVRNNPVKYKKVSDQAYEVKDAAEDIYIYIQEMKYDLVNKCDGEVYLGEPSDILDEDGDPIEDKAIVDKEFSELTPKEKTFVLNNPIGFLGNKSDRSTAGDLFYPKAGDRRASKLKKKIEAYKTVLMKHAKDNKELLAKINMATDVADKPNSGKDEPWEKYNFQDMPSVGALTILSKIQSDTRGVEADMIDYLKRDIEDKLLKFEDAAAITIPKSNFILRGDSFTSQIFIAANNKSVDPEIWVGYGEPEEIYKDLGGDEYQMIGSEGKDYEVVKVRDGKGFYASKTRTQGLKKYGGLIAMKSEKGTKFYPFSGEYVVAEVKPVVAPDWMNKVYLEIDNPISVSVPGYNAADVEPRCRNCSAPPKPTNKSEGQWTIRPSKLTSGGKAEPLIDLYVKENGKKPRLMGTKDLRVVKLDVPKIQVAKKQGGSIDAGALLNSGKMIAKASDPDIPERAVRYKIISFFWKPTKGQAQKNDGFRFEPKLTNEIGKMKAGESIIFRNIVYKQLKCKSCKPEEIPNLQMVFDIE